MAFIIKSQIISIVLAINLIHFTNSASVVVTDDGPGVQDIPITFGAQLVGEVPMDVNQFVYVFEDNVYPRHRSEIISDRSVNYTITYSEVSTGKYIMKVQVFSYIWGFKGWLVAEDHHKFALQNGLSGNINISQSGLSEKAISDSIVSTNRTVSALAIINDGTHFLKNASTSYTWIVDGRTFGPNPSPVLNHNFTENKTYNLYVMVMVNISLSNRTVTKLGQFQRLITAKNDIKGLNVTGNTWLLHGALLQLDFNCTGGSPPFWYCLDIFTKKEANYSCSGRDLKFINKCSFPITHYFAKNGTYYIEIGLYNDVDYKNKTTQVNVYDIVRQTQLSFVIIPIVSSILAIIIVVVGIAYHLHQRQKYNITLEVADFDFQHNEDLNEKTFFERLRESFASSLRGTLLHPCTRAQNDDLIDDLLPDQRIGNNNSSTHINNTNNTSYEVIK